MNKYAKISVGLLFVAALVVQNCTKENELNLNLTDIGSLSNPADNTFVQLKPSNLTTGSVVFEWDQSRAEDGSLVLYDVVFDQAGGDFSKPFFITVSDGKGLQNKLTMPYSDLNNVAKAGGLDFFQKKKFIWTARASKGSNIKLAGQTRNIEIERPGGFTVIPASLFLTGTATESGSTLANAVEMTRLSPGVFEVYTKLIAGNYQMVDAISGTPKAFSVTVQEGANVLIPDGQTAFSGTPGVYRFTVNFNSISATSPKEIQRVGFWLCAANDTLATLKYQSRGLWQASDVTINLVNFGWGIDDRYKYRLYLADGTTEFWGYEGNDSPGPDGNYPSGFSATYNNAFNNGPADNQYDYSWKFDKPAVNGKSVNLLLKFQSPAYSNQYIVN
jgi:starch-binding outer membrane protein SusE/F